MIPTSAVHAQLQEIAQIPVGRVLLTVLFALVLSSLFTLAIMHRLRTRLTYAETRNAVLTSILDQVDRHAHGMHRWAEAKASHGSAAPASRSSWYQP